MINGGVIRNKINKINISIFATIFLISCGSHNDPTPGFYWNPMLEPYYHEMAKDLQPYGIEMPNMGHVAVADFWPADSDDLSSGVCITQFASSQKGVEVDKYIITTEKDRHYEWREIFIQPHYAEYIKQGNEYQTITIKALMYHEMGHCFFNLDHSTCEQNLMYPTLSFRTEEMYQKAFKMMVKMILYGTDSCEP